MYKKKKCVICKHFFQPRTYRHTMCSYDCRQKWKKIYADNLTDAGYFQQYQHDHKDVINPKNNARYAAKIGRDADGLLPARNCKECGTSFQPKYNGKKFCTDECSAKHRSKNQNRKKIA